METISLEMLNRDDVVATDTASVKESQSEEEKDDEVADKDVRLCWLAMTVQ